MILLVDEEDALRTAMALHLERHGYVVLSAANATEGLTFLAQHQSEIGLIIADLRMPGMDGREMVHRAAQQFGPRPVLYIAPVAEEATDRTSALCPSAICLEKPFDLSELLVRVRLLLSMRDSATVAE